MSSISIYLDKRIKDKNGLSPVKLVIRNKGTVAYRTTGINLPESCWQEGKIKSSKELITLGKSAKTEELRVRNIYRMYEVAYLEVEKTKTNRNAKAIMDEVVKYVEGDKKEHTICSVAEEFLYDKISSQKKKGMFRSVVKAVRKINKSISDGDIKDVKERDVILVRDKWETIYKANTINDYLGMLSTIYGYAKKKGYVRSGDDNPFRIPTKNAIVVRRNIDIRDFRRIWNGEILDETKIGRYKASDIRRALDVFKLSFCLCGLNIADLYSLKTSDIINGRIESNRKKTGVRISVKLEPEAEEIIKRTEQGGWLIGKDKGRSRDATYLARLNRRLGQIMPGLTSYYARHTWATLAFDLDVSDHVIAMGLSHETGKANTNHFYINNDYRKLDRANRMVIDYVEGKIELD